MHPASNTKKYVRDKNDKIYQRSIYVYWKRTSPHPMMTLFDAPDRESSCVMRSEPIVRERGAVRHEHLSCIADIRVALT